MIGLITRKSYIWPTICYDFSLNLNLLHGCRPLIRESTTQISCL